MSICRFSSDDWKSDVYVYYSARGIVINVASNRFVDLDDMPKLSNNMSTEEMVETMIEQTNFVSRVERVDINGLFDGKSFYVNDEEEAYSMLRSIQNAGYHVPEFVFEELKSRRS